MTNPIKSRNNSLAVLLLSFMALAMLPACSSDSEEAPPPDTGGLEDCTVYTGQVDRRECEIRNEMRQ